MQHRGVIATLLLIIVIQLAGGVLFAATCEEPCADDGPGATCPPLCSLCTNCRQQAILQTPMTAVAVDAIPHAAGVHQVPALSQFATDIFHVPLPG